MPFVGRVLTDMEKQNVQAPFAKNSGLKWDLRTIGEYVRAGAAALQKDSAASSEIAKGVQSLGGNLSEGK